MSGMSVLHTVWADDVGTVKRAVRRHLTRTKRTITVKIEGEKGGTQRRIRGPRRGGPRVIAAAVSAERNRVAISGSLRVPMKRAHWSAEEHSDGSNIVEARWIVGRHTGTIRTIPCKQPTLSFRAGQVSLIRGIVARKIARRVATAATMT